MTQSEMLKLILEEQKTIKENQTRSAIKFMEVAGEVSSQLNDVNNKYQHLCEKLENNLKTGKLGLINKVDIIDERVTKIETRQKITMGKVITATAIFTGVGAVVWRLIEFLEIKFK